MYDVYIKIDINNVITQIISDFESVMMGVSLDGFIKIDSGEGDKFAHASGSYLAKGVGSYKYVDGIIVELTEAEKESLAPKVVVSDVSVEKNRADIDYIALMLGVSL